MFRFRKPGFVALSLLCMVLVVSGCFSAGASPNNVSAGSAAEQVLSRVHQDGSFVFEELPWLTSREEAVKQKKLDDAAPDKDAVQSKGSLPVDKSIEQIVTYTFQEDKLVSGEYVFLVPDKGLFTGLAGELKEALAKSTLGTPMTNNSNALDQADESAQAGKSIAWEGKDGSHMKINLLSAKLPDGKPGYMLQIQSGSPLPERKSLKP